MPARASCRYPSRGVEFNTFGTAWSGVRCMAGVNSPYLGDRCWPAQWFRVRASSFEGSAFDPARSPMR